MINREKICLVLGANGFVGSYLVDRLAQTAGVRVRAFDRYSHGEPKFKRMDNIEIVKGDIQNDDDLRMALVGVDSVIHSFSATTPFMSDNNPYIDISTNLARSVSIFDMCAAEEVNKIGFISSGGAVYGSIAEVKAVTEDDAPQPVSPYGINKLSIEHYLEYFKRKHNIEYVVYRLSNPYGPRQILKNSQGVIPSFIDKISQDSEILIYGDGTSSRDYIYMEDAAQMVIDSFVAGSNKHTVYNIGSGTQTSLNNILSTLRKILNKEPHVAYTEAPATFLHSTSISTARYAKEYGLPQLTSLYDGLAKTVASLAK